MNILITKVSSTEDMQKCLDIRTTVFVMGQNVPQCEDTDGKDQDSAHYLLTIDSIPVGVARVRYIEDFAKIERVAILNDYEKLGFSVCSEEYMDAKIPHKDMVLHFN